MIKTTVGIYNKNKLKNLVGIKLKSTSINSPIKTKNIKINLLNTSFNVINDVFMYPYKIIVNGIKFKESLSRTLNDDEYYYDNFNHQIIFNNSVNNVLIEYKGNSLITGDCMPVLGYPVIGASLTRSWQEQPSGSITLAVPLEGLQGHLAALQPGLEFEWLGVGLAIGSISINQSPQLTKLNILELTLQVEGKWSNYLKPCQYTDSSNSFGITTLQQIAQRNGAILEFPTWPIVIPRDNYLESFDWSSILDGIGKIDQKYVYWSDYNAIKLKNIDLNPTKIIFNPIDSIKITQNKSYEYHSLINNQNLLEIKEGAENYTEDIRVFDKIYYPYKKENYPFVFDKVKISSNVFLYEDGRLQNEILQYLNFTTFKYRSRDTRTVKKGSRAVPSFATGKVRDLSVAADITGYTQPYNEITTLDEKPYIEIDELWGFLVNSDDVGQSLSSKWSIISSVITIHKYDNLGYYLGYNKLGFRKERYDIEDPKSPKTLNNTNRKYYQWSSLPVNESYEITLAPFNKYYITDNTQEYFIENDIVIYDKTYIEPYFVINEKNISVSIEIIDNPRKPRFKLTKGTEKINIKQVIPFSATQMPYFISPSSYSKMELDELKDKEGYTTTEVNFSSEGGQFNTSIIEDSGTFHKGQPSVAASLPTQFTKMPVIDEEKLKPPLLSDFYKAIIVKNKDYKSDSRGKSLSYPEASTLDDVKQSLYTDWIINNVKNGIIVSFEIQGLYDGYEGESIILNSDNILYKGIILSIQYNIENNFNSFEINNLDSKTEIKIGLIPEDKVEDLIDIILVNKNSIITVSSPLYLSNPFDFNSIVLTNSRYSQN
jgi:hypothetical protein